MTKKLRAQEYVEDAIRSVEEGRGELRAAKSEIEGIVDELVEARSTIQGLEERIATMEFEAERQE